MAVTPVLERKVNTEENVAEESTTAAVSRTTTMSADECHNSRIKVNYAKLINPDTTVGDVLPKEPVRQQQQMVEPVRAQKPYLVDSARTRADIFRADSAINNRHNEEARAEEEENEDLRPTAETFKYKAGASKVVIEDKVGNKQTKASKMRKRDKVVLIVSLLVIVALFVLVIINSAVLSNLNSEISSLQANLETVKDSYTEVVQNKEAYLEPQNILQVVSEFAQKFGMIKI